MARSDIGVRVRAVGLDKSIVKQARAGERVVASKPIKLKLDSKGFALPLGRITGQMSEFQKSLDASAARVFAFGAAVGVINSVGNAFKALIKDSIELNKSLTELNSIFKLTSSNLQKFGGDLFDVARNTGQAFADVTDAATEFSRQGLTATETLKRLNDAMVLTRLSGLQATDSVKYLTAAINGFNKEALSSTEIVNRLANVDAGFAVSSRDLADAISRSGASAQAAKVEFNELLAIVTSVQQQTARGGAVIGNAFKTIFTRLQRSSVRNALEDIGVATENANGSLRSATAILVDYAKAYQTLTDQQRAYTAEQVAGVRQVNNLKALVTDMAGQYGIYNRALGTANNTTNEATRRNEEYNKTIAAMAHQTSLSVKEMSAAIGELTMGPGAERVLGMIQSIADFFNKVLDPQEGNRLAQGFMKGIGAYIAGPGLILIGGAFLKLFTIMGKLGLDAVKSIFAVNTETQRRRALEEAILALLIKEENAMNKLQAAGVTQAQKEKIVLDLLRQQTAERQRQASFLASLSGLPGLKGVAVNKKGHVVGKSPRAAANLQPRADGHVPNFSSMAKSMEVIQAIGLGASKNTKAMKGRDRVGNYYYNNEEVRVTSRELGGMGLNSKGRDLILPTYGAAKQENLKKLGGKLGISASNAESLFMGNAQGFVPNFRAPNKRAEMTFTEGKGLVSGKQKGAQKVGTYAPNVGAVVSQTPKGMGHAFQAKGRVGLSNVAMRKVLEPIAGPYRGNYFADFSFPVGGLRQADFRKELKNHFKFEEFVAALGFGAGNKPKMVHTNLESAMDKVGRNQGLGRIFEAAILQGLRMQDLPEEGTWDIPNWQGVRGKYTLGLPSKTRDVDVKYNIMESKGNKTMVTMFQKALVSRPKMRNQIGRNIRNKEGHTMSKRRATGFVPNFAVMPVRALGYEKATADYIKSLSTRQLSGLMAKTKGGDPYPTIPKDFINPLTGQQYTNAAERRAAIEADFKNQGPLYKMIQARHEGHAVSKKIATSIDKAKGREAEARRIIFGLTSPQTASVIAPTPGLKGVQKGEYNVPGFGKVKMGYRMFGYNDAGPAAQQLGNLDHSVRNWSKNKATALSNLMTPGKHLFQKFASEGGISGAVGSIFETAVQMALNLPAFKKETGSFDYPRGTGAISKLKKGGLFPGLTGDWVDASVNPADKTHMFKKIFNSIVVGGGYFKKGKGDTFVSTGKKMPTIPSKGKGGRFGAGKAFTLASGFVPNFASWVWDSDVFGGSGKKPFPSALNKLLESGKPIDVAMAPSGAGKTYWAANKFGMDRFIKTDADLMQAVRSGSGDRIMALSAMGETKAGGLSPMAKKLLDASVRTGGTREYLYRSNMQLLANRNMRMSGGAHSLDPRSTKQLAGVKRAPLNQFGFLSMLRKKYGAKIRKLNEGSVPNFAASLAAPNPFSARGGGTPFRLPPGFSFSKPSWKDTLKKLPKNVLEKLKNLKDLSGLEVMKLLQKYPALQKINLNKLDDFVTPFFGGGFVPNFSNDVYDGIQTSLRTESALTGRDSALGYDSRVGLGVYDPVKQDSLTTAISRDHLGRGQSLGEALQASAKAQDSMAFSAAGFIPNFGAGFEPLPYFARYSPEQQVKILNEMSKKGERIPFGGMPTKAQVVAAATSAKVGKPEIQSTKSAGLHGKSAASKIAARSQAATAQLQSYLKPQAPGAEPRLRYEQLNVGPTAQESKVASSNLGKSSSKVDRERFRQTVAAETSAAQQTQAARTENTQARAEEKKFREQEAKERKKEARNARMQMGLLGLSMAGPVLSQMVGETQPGDIGKGAMKGALSGVGIGAMVPMMMNNPAGWAIGGGIVAFSALKEAMASVQKSSETLGLELDNENAKRQQNINATNRFIQAQNNLDQAYKAGDVKQQVKSQEDLLNALNKIGDPEIRKKIIATGGDLDKLGKVIAQLGEEAERRSKIADTLKIAMGDTDKRRSWAGRGSVTEQIEKMREVAGEGAGGDMAAIAMRFWGNVGQQSLGGGGGPKESVFESLTKGTAIGDFFGIEGDTKGFLGTRLGFDELEQAGQGIASAVRLTSKQVAQAYELLGKNTVDSSRKILTDYFQLSGKEANIVMQRLDFKSGELATMLQSAIKAEEKMIIETAELEAAVMGGVAALSIMDGEIARTADVLHQKMLMVSEGFKKMSKTLTTLRKSSVSGLSAMGLMTQRQASDDIMKFQEDIILQQAQLDTENVLRELLTETKDFNNKALKEAYQGSISTDFSDPLSFQGDKIISILNRDSELIKGTQAATLDLVDKEAEALIELKKININSALSLIELRAQSLAERKAAERKSFAQARDPLSLENTQGLRRGFQEMLGKRGRPSVASEAETFTRLKDFFKIVEERFGVKSEDLQSKFFKGSMQAGGQFQELYNLLHFADELSGFTGLHNDMRARMDDAPPAAMENRKDQQKWLVRNLLGGQGFGLGDVDSIAKLFPGINLKPGQTVADFFASKDPKQMKEVAAIRQQIIGGMFTDEAATKWKGDARFETIVEMIGKSLLRMVTTARLENLTGPQLEKHKFSEEKGFLQKAINDLIKEGKLEVKDIQNIFGAEVNAKGEIQSTTDRGLAIVKALVKDLATIKTPEFKTLTAIQSNTGDTARLLHDYLTLQSRNERVKETAEASKARKEFFGPKITELSDSTSSLGQFDPKVTGETGKDFVFNLMPRRAIGSSAGFYTRLTEPGTSGMVASRQDHVKLFKDNLKHPAVDKRGTGSGSYHHSIPAMMELVSDPAQFDERIGSLAGLRWGRTKWHGASSLEQKAELDKAKEDILTMMVETLVNEAKARLAAGDPIAPNENLFSSAWFTAARKDPTLVGGHNPALSNIAGEGQNPIPLLLALYNNLRLGRGQQPGTDEDLSNWIMSSRAEGGAGLRESLKPAILHPQVPFPETDKSHLLGESLRENPANKKVISDLEAKLKAERDRIQLLRTQKAGAVHPMGQRWENLDIPDFSKLDGKELVDALRRYEAILTNYESALSNMPEDEERRHRKASVERQFAKDITSATEAQRRIEDRLETARAELKSVSDQLASDPTNTGLQTQLVDRQKEVDQLEGRLGAQTTAIEQIISQKDAAIKLIDSEALIIASSLEGAAHKLDDLPGTAKSIAAALIATNEIFKKMKEELDALEGGQTPPRLRGKGVAAPWMQQMPTWFKKLWSTKSNASGFIPNFAPDPEQRALQTEKKMGGPRSRPRLGWSPRVAKLQQGDGRMVFDPGSGQHTADMAIDQHLRSGESLRTAIKNSAQYQGGVGMGIPNFQQAPVPVENFPATTQVMDAMFTRLGIPQNQRAAGRRRLQRFLTRVGHMESDYDSSAQNTTTSASGTFQFTRGSAITATNRLENLLDARGLDMPQWASNYRTTVRGTAGNRRAYGTAAGNLTDDQARALTLANLDQAVIPGQPGRGDLLLRQVITGDPGARGSVFRPSNLDSMEELYRRIHHTNPDQATRNRMATGGFFHRNPTNRSLRDALGGQRGFAAGFIPNFVNPDVRVPAIDLDQINALKDIALDAHGHPKGFHSAIEKIVADEDALNEIAKRLGVPPGEVPALIHKNIKRGNIPQQQAAADKASKAFPKPSPGTLLPPSSGGGLTQAGLPDWTNKPGKKVRHVEKTLQRYISQELAGAALLEKAGIPHGGILGSTPHGVIKADLSKTHVDLEDWYDQHTKNSPAAPKPGSSQAVKDAWARHQKPRQVLDLLQMKFRTAAEEAGLTGRGRQGVSMSLAKAMDMRATNFMVPANIETSIRTALNEGKNVDQVVNEIWKSRDVKFVDPGFVATNEQIDRFEKGHDITTDIKRTGPHRFSAAPPRPSRQKGAFGTFDLPYEQHDEIVKKATDQIRAKGQALDKSNFKASSLSGKDIKFHGNQSGRNLIEVALPDGRTQFFYHSTGMGNKPGTLGTWQPYGGHKPLVTNSGLVPNWFIKDKGYKNFYGSQSLEDISKHLDDLVPQTAEVEGWDLSKQKFKQPQAPLSPIESLRQSTDEINKEVARLTALKNEKDLQRVVKEKFEGSKTGTGGHLNTTVPPSDAELREIQKNVKKKHAIPDAPSRGARFWGKLGRLIPFLSSTLGLYGAKQYADRGDAVRATLTSIGAIPGAEIADLAALGIDLGETLLWGGPSDLTPEEEGLMMYLQEKGYIQEGKKNFFGKPEEGGAEFGQIKDYALMQLQAEEMMKRKGLTPKLGPLGSFDVDRRNEILTKEAEKLESLARTQKLMADFKTRQEKYTIPEGWDKHYAPWEAEQHEQMLRDIQIAKMRKELKEGPKPPPAPRKLTPSQAAEEAKRQELAAQQRAEATKKWKEYWDQKRKEGFGNSSIEGIPTLDAIEVIGRRDGGQKTRTIHGTGSPGVPRRLNAQGFIPSFATPARTASDRDVAASVARFTKTPKSGVKNRGDLRSLPKFNEDVWRTFHLMTLGYPEEDIRVKEGEEWRGIKGPTTVYGKNTLTKRMQARLQDPISGYEFDGKGQTIQAMYYGNLSGAENDTIILNKSTYSNLSKGIRFKHDVSSLNNELTHFIQDNVLKVGGTMAPNYSKKVGSVTIGITDQERLLMRDNVEALAWEFYRKNRHHPDGGLKALKDFAEWKTEVYGKKHGKWESVYGGSTTSQKTQDLRLFQEIAAAHGDHWGSSKITVNKAAGGKYASLRDYHEANKNRPEWMDDLGPTGTKYQRDFTEVQSSYIGKLSPLIGGPPTPATAQAAALQQSAIGQGVDVWKLGNARPAGDQVVDVLGGELEQWRKAKNKGNIWSEPEKASGPVTTFSPHAAGGTVPVPLIATDRGVVDQVGGLARNRAQRFKRRGVHIAPGSFAGGFIPNFTQTFTGAMRGLSDESFLPNFGILEDELDQINNRLFPHKTVEWWRNLRNKGWQLDGRGGLIHPQGAEADLGEWTHPLMGMSKGKHRKQVRASVRSLSSEYLEPLAGETPEAKEARIAAFAQNTISETDPIKNFPRAQGLMYRAMSNIISGMPPEMKNKVWARYKEREKLPWHIMGVEDKLLQQTTGAGYDPKSNTIVLSKGDIAELRTSDVSPELRERFMKQFIVQMQDEVLREVGTSGSHSLRGEQVGSMKITGATFGEGDPWSAGKVEHVMETTGFSPEEAEWGRRSADNLLWDMWDAASATAPDDAEFIRRINEVAEEEKNWAKTRVSYGVGSLMDSRSTSTNAFGYTVSRWIKKRGGQGGYWQHDYKSEIEDKLAEVSRGHGGYSDWRKHGRSPRKKLMFEINDRVAEAKFGRLGEYIRQRKKAVGKDFPVNEMDRQAIGEYDALKQRAAAQAGPLARLFGDPHKFKLGIYSTAKVYGSLDEYRRSQKPIEQRVAEYQGADPLEWTGEKHSKHFEKLLRDTGYDAELAEEHKRLKVLTQGYRDRVEAGGAPYSEKEFNEIIRFRELNQGLLAQRGKGEVVTSLAKQIKAEKDKINDARKLGHRELRFPHTDAHRDLLKRYEEAKRGNARMNFRSGMGSMATLGARIGRWAPWEEGADFDERKKQEKRTEKARKKYLDPDGTAKTDPATGLAVAYWRRNAKGKKIPEDYVNPLTGEMNQPLYGSSAFAAWQADEYKIRARKEYEASDVYKDLQRQKEIREQMHKINSVANANDALRRVGYSDEEIKKFGIGFTTMSKKDLRELESRRARLAANIETKKILARQGATAPGPAPAASLEESIRADEIKLAAMDLRLDKNRGRQTPQQLEKTHAELNEDFTTLFKIREKLQTGGRLGRYHETEYDVVSGEIEAIKKRRRDDQRNLTDKQIMRAAAGAEGMGEILRRNGINEEDAHAITNGVPVNRVAQGAEAKKIKALLLKYGPPRLRPKDYAAALRGPQSNFGRMEISTERALRGRRQDLFMDAAKLENWIRNVGGGNMTEQEFLEVYSQMDMKTRRRTKTALRSLTSRTIGEGIMYGGTGLEGQVKLAALQGQRGPRTEAYNNLLDVAELKDDSEKIDFIKNLIANDGLGAYMTKNPQNQEEMTDIIDNYWDHFVREVDFNADGTPDEFEALPGLQNGLVMDIIRSKTMDETGMHWNLRGGELIDKQAREDRKAKYVKDLARTRRLAAALTGPNGATLREYIENHPNKASLGNSPALNLLNSGQADSQIPGLGSATTLQVLSALQNGTFMAKFMHLDPSQRSLMLQSLQDLKVYNGGESLLDEGTKKRVRTQILKDQGITLDYTGQVALNRKDFDSSDDYFRAKDRRREDFLEKKAAARQAALDARTERIKFGDPERVAREAKEREFRMKRDAAINARVAAGKEPLRELENLATGFIPNLKLVNTREEQYRKWQESGKRIPGPTNKFQPEYPGQIPRRAAPPIDPQVAKDQQYQDILQSRMVGEYDPITGLEKGDWDYRGYMKMADTPAVPGSKVLPSLIKGREAQKGEEWFSIAQQSGSTGEWIKGSSMKGRTLQLGNQQVEIVGNQGENIQVKTQAGEILTIPLRGQAAMAASQETRNEIAAKAMESHVAAALDEIYGTDEREKIFQGKITKDEEREAAWQAMEDSVILGTNSNIRVDKDGNVVANGGGFIPNFSPKGQSAVVNEITANKRLGQHGVKPSDVGFVRLNAGRGRSPVQGTMVEKGHHAEDLVKTEVGDFVVPAGGQRAAYASRLQKQADAAGLHGLPAAVMGQANAQGFIPNLQDANVGISNVEEMRGLVERFEGTAQQIATTITEGSMEISHALNIEGKVAGLDQGQLIDALQGAMNETASIEANRQIGNAFNDNTLNSDVAPPPTDVPRFNRPGNN